MKLYSMILIARRTVGEKTEIQVHPTLIIQETPEALLQEAGQIMFAQFPLTDGWIDHQMVSMEIEQNLVFDDGHRLVWQLEKTDQSTEEDHGTSETIDH